MTTPRPTPSGLALSLILATALGACAGSGYAPPSLTPPTTTCSAAGVTASNASTRSTVCVLTSQGEFVVELYAGSTEAPVTVANFLRYVTGHYYDLTIFHRVVHGFVVQGGGLDTSYRPLQTFPAIALENQNGLSNLRGTVAMARTNLPNSATNQFFVNLVDNSTTLDYDPTVSGPNGYAVFGKVISGMSTIDKIGALATNASEQPQPMVILYWAQQLK